MALVTTYTVTGKTSGQITFKFDLNGDLMLFKYEGDALTEKQRNWMYPRIPINEKQMDIWKAIKTFTVIKGEPVITFDAFWKTYGKKQKLTRAKQLWSKLTDTEKFNAIAKIKSYNNWLARQNGTPKMLPDTYIYQKRWLDDFNN